MVFVYGTLAALLILYLLLRISGMQGASKTVVAVPQMNGNPPEQEFDPPQFNTAPLPAGTEENIHEAENTTPVEWVVYDGATPPLRLKLRGQSYEAYRQLARAHIDEIGQSNVARFSQDQLDAFNRTIIADAYVLDWEGALDPNGNPVPYSPANLSARLGADPHLLKFVAEEARRISPAWPAR